VAVSSGEQSVSITIGNVILSVSARPSESWGNKVHTSPLGNARFMPKYWTRQSLKKQHARYGIYLNGNMLTRRILIGYHLGSLGGLKEA